MFHPIQRFQEKRPEIREKSRRGAGHVIFSRGLLVALLLAAPTRCPSSWRFT